MLSRISGKYGTQRYTRKPLREKVFPAPDAPTDIKASVLSDTEVKVKSAGNTITVEVQFKLKLKQPLLTQKDEESTTSGAQCERH